MGWMDGNGGIPIQTQKCLPHPPFARAILMRHNKKHMHINTLSHISKKSPSSRHPLGRSTNIFLPPPDLFICSHLEGREKNPFGNGNSHHRRAIGMNGGNWNGVWGSLDKLRQNQWHFPSMLCLSNELADDPPTFIISNARKC